MRTVICENKKELGKRAAKAGAALIRQAIKKNGHANIIVATGASQFEMLSTLITIGNIAWDKVTGFHLDEYVGLPISHPASFRRYLWQRFVSRLPLPLSAFHFISGEGDTKIECARLARLIGKLTIDVAFVGIGENGHLAFNDPPADFKTLKPYQVVELDEACRRQQLGEGWFKTMREVPARAISMSCRQIMKSRAIICSVPDQRKARAVQKTVQGAVTPDVPASILQRHAAISIYLDRQSAALLKS